MIKMVFHIDEMEKFPMVLGNCENALAYGRTYGETLGIAVVANGIAVLGLTERKARAVNLYDTLQALSAAGVELCACHNALKGQNLDAAALCPFVKEVPAGIIALATFQANGYAYIRP